MPVQCPHCRAAMELKGAQVGRYTPKCPRCGKTFVLTIPADGNQRPIATALPAGGPAAKRPAAAPVPPARAAVADATMASGSGLPSAAPKPPAAAVEATLASQPGVPAPAPKPQTVAVDATVVSRPAAPSRAKTNADVTMPSSVERPDVPSPPPPSTAGATADVTMPSHADRASPSKPAEAQADVTAPSGVRSSAAAVADPPAGDMPARLGGYDIVKELGRGGMGSVYLAKQTSLDRRVAVKVMNPQWASNPMFLSRFTREAYAAAQLVHHNVVQIYDIGEAHDINFFSMEFVEGQSLGDLVKNKGRLDAEEAVGYILQAARGLKFAHDQGMIHRDIKPDNLMLNKHGIVKVADLGLVKTPGAVEADIQREDADGGGKPPLGRELGAERHAADSAKAREMSGINVTNVNQAMGTPAYMPPEQSQNAAGVDHRADIYSLGCTLYVMVTGRPVFEGNTAVEVMTKHASEPVVPPDVVVKRVSPTLSQIIMKMVAKEPKDRFQTMDEVIAALEDFLGISSTGPFTPREEHAAALEEAVKTFNNSSAFRLRGRSMAGFFIALTLMTLLAAVTGHGILAGGLIGLGVLCTLCYFILTGLTQKTFLFTKVRGFVLGSGVGDWLMFLLGLVLFVVLLAVFNLLWIWVGFCVLAAGLAAGFYFVIDRKVAAEQGPAVAHTQDMLKSLRLRGLEEDALRQFVCRYSGECWEPFFEALFGYEAKLAARQRWGKGEQGRARPKFRAWREPLVQWIDARQQQRQQRREKKHLEAVERKALKARGLSDAEAQRKAQAAAETMVARAAEIKQEAAQHAGEETVASPSGPRPVMNFNQVIAEGQSSADQARRDKLRKEGGYQEGGLLNFVLGSRARFVYGTLLIVGCVMWMNQNALIQADQIKDLSQRVIEQRDVQGDAAEEMRAALTASVDLTGKETKPLEMPLLPASIAQWFNSFNPGIAGLMLVFTCFFRGVRMGAFLVPAAVVIVCGAAWGIPPVWKIPAEYMSLTAGAGLLALGLAFGRR